MVHVLKRQLFWIVHGSTSLVCTWVLSLIEAGKRSGHPGFPDKRLLPGNVKRNTRSMRPRLLGKRRLFQDSPQGLGVLDLGGERKISHGITTI